MGDEIAAHGRGDGGAQDLQELVEKARNEGSLLRHGRPQRLDPNRFDPRRFKRRLSGESESEKVTIPGKMNAQQLLFAKCGFRKTTETTVGTARAKAFGRTQRPEPALTGRRPPPEFTPGLNRGRGRAAIKVDRIWFSAGRAGA